MSSENAINKSREIKKSSEKAVKEDNDSGKLILEEERAVGAVSMDVFKYYSKKLYGHYKYDLLIFYQYFHGVASVI